MIKIFQLCFGDGYAGSAKMAIVGSDLLARKGGYDITFFASVDSLTAKRAKERKLKVIEINSRLPFNEILEKISAEFEKVKPDVVISHHSLDRKLGMKLRSRFKEDFVNVGYRHNISQSAPLIGAVIYNFYFDYLIACGTGVGKSLTSAGIFKKKVKVIHYGIEIPGNINSLSGKEIREKHKLHGKIVVGISAWFHKERKGFDILFDVFSKLDDNYRLLIIGIPEAGQKEVLEYAAQFNIPRDKIIMPGYVENIFEYYKAMDLFVFPSRSEGFPLAPLEAGAAKLPVIASNIRGTNEFIEDDVNGILFEIKDRERFLQSIKRVGNSAELKEKFGINAYNTVMEKYTDVIYGNNLDGFLKEIVKK